MKPKINYGLVDSLPDPQDFTLGTINKPVLNTLADWRAFTPEFEKQIGTWEDTYGCVTFSALNCLEILFYMQYKFFVNFSDRFTVKMSGTVPGRGNTFKRVADSIRNDGFLMEEDYPWDRKSNEQYYQEIPDYYGSIQYPYSTLKRRAQLLGESYDIGYEWVGWNGVSRETLREALKYGPLQVTVFAWLAPKKGVYDYYNESVNHAVTLVAVNPDDSCVIFDSYDSSFKTLSPKFYIGAALLYSIKLKTVNPVTFATLFKVNQGRWPILREYIEYKRTGILPFI